MPEYGRYKTASAYRKRNWASVVGDSFAETMSLGKAIASMISETGTPESRENAIFEADHQSEFDSYDKAFNDYTNRLKDNEDPVSRPVSLDEMTFEAFQSLVPDADQKVFDVWKSRRDYSPSDVYAGLSFAGVNIHDGNISSKSNFMTREAALYKEYETRADAYMNMMLYGDSKTGAEGFFDRMLQDDDYTRYDDEVDSYLEGITAQSLKSNLGGPLEFAEKYMSGSMPDVISDAKSRTALAKNAAQTAKIQANTESVRALQQEKISGIGVNDAWSGWRKAVEDAGAELLPGFSWDDEFIVFADSYIQNNGEMAIDANPELADSSIDDFIDAQYSQLAERFPDKAADITERRDDQKTHLKKYRETSYNEQYDDLERLADSATAALDDIYSQGYSVSNDYIFQALGISDPSDMLPFQRQLVAPVIQRNNQLRAMASISQDIVESIDYSARTASRTNSPQKRSIVLTMDSGQEMSDAIRLQEAEEDEAIQDVMDAAGSAGIERPDITDNVETIPSVSVDEAIGQNGFTTRDAYADQMIARWFYAGQSTGVLWNGSGEPADGSQVVVRDGDAFMSYVESIGADTTNMSLMMKLAYMWETSYTDQTDSDSWEETNKRVMKTLKEACYALPSDMAREQVDKEYAIGSISAEDVNDLIGLIGDGAQNPESKEIGKKFMDYCEQIIENTGLADDDDAYWTIYDQLTNDGDLIQEFSDYSKTHGGENPDIELWRDRISNLMNQEASRNVTKSLKSFDLSSLGTGWFAIGGSVIDSASSASSNFKAWSNGEVQPWRFDDSFFTESRDALLTNPDTDMLLDNAARHLTKRDDAEYDDLTWQEQRICQLNAEMAVYMYGVPTSLAAAIDKGLDSDGIYTVSIEGSGDIGILDERSGIVYMYANMSNQEYIRMIRVDVEQLDIGDGFISVPTSVMERSPQALWRRGFREETTERMIAGDYGSYTEGQRRDLIANDVQMSRYMTASGSKTFERCYFSLMKVPKEYVQRGRNAE